MADTEVDSGGRLLHTRRDLVRAGVGVAGAFTLGPAFWKALAAPAPAGPSPYGPLGAPDANGIRLPEGFSSRIVARGNEPVEGTSYVWHIFSDPLPPRRANPGRLSHPLGHQLQLRGGPDPLEDLALLRGGRGRDCLGVRSVGAARPRCTPGARRLQARGGLRRSSARTPVPERGSGRWRVLPVHP
jgi:hypothetical protein